MMTTTATNWCVLDSFLFEKEPKDRDEKFKTYLSPYMIPKAFRYELMQGDRVVIEFKYIGVPEEETTRIANLETHKVYFEVGKKTGRVYKIFLHLTHGKDNSSVRNHHNEIKRALEKIAIKKSKSIEVNTIGQYSATLEATNQCLSKMKSNKVIVY